MSKIWLVARQHILYTLSSWAYWLMMLMPLWFILMSALIFGLTTWAAGLPTLTTLPAPTAPRWEPEPFAQPVGYVDEADLIHRWPPALRPEDLRAYATQAEARAALTAGAIAGYYWVPPDYRAGAPPIFYSLTPLILTGTDAEFQKILTANLLEAESEAVAWRFTDPAQFTRRRVDSTQLAYDPLRGLSVAHLMQAGLLLSVFIFLLLDIAPYWLMFLATENRQGTLDILLNSMSAREFLFGKLLGTLVILLVELAAAGVWFGLVRGSARLLDLETISKNPEIFTALLAEVSNLTPATWALVVACVVGGVLVYSAGLILIGALFPSHSAARFKDWFLVVWQAGAFIILLGALIDIDGPLTCALSVFPLTAPLVMSLRLLVGPVPAWQVIVSLSLMLALTVFGLWLVVVLFQFRLRWTGIPWARLSAKFGRARMLT